MTPYLYLTCTVPHFKPDCSAEGAVASSYIGECCTRKPCAVAPHAPTRTTFRGASPVEPQRPFPESMFTRLDILVVLATASALQPPKAVGKTGTSLKFDAADAMADMIAAQHALKLESVRKAKEEVYASYAEKIAALEQELAARTEVPIYSSNAAAAPAPARVDDGGLRPCMDESDGMGVQRSPAGFFARRRR